MKNQIDIIELEDPSCWDRYVRNHPASTHCHLHGWKRVIENAYGHKTFYLAATVRDHKEGESRSPAQTRVKGVLPLVHLSHFIGGNRLVSLPFVDAAGILADSREIEIALLEKAIDLGRELKSDYLELRHGHPSGIPAGFNYDPGIPAPDPSLSDRSEPVDLHGSPGFPGSENPAGSSCCFKEADAEPFSPVPATFPLGDFCSRQGCIHRVFRHKVGLAMSLPGSSQELMGSFPSKLRSQIRKAMKNGLSAEVGRIELIPPFFEVFAQNMRDLGSPVHSRRLFENLMKTFSHDTEIVIVRKQGKPVAGSLVIRYGDTLKNPWASSLRKYRPLSPNMLLYWTMLEHACNSGLSRFDFGRSSKGAGTHRFKLQWGAASRPLSWHCFLLGDPPGDPVKESLNLKWWRRIPVPLSKLVGPGIRKHISL